MSLKLKRSIESLRLCSPQAMAHNQSDAAKEWAFADMKHDILALYEENLALKALLCKAAYPRRGTPEEGITMVQFAALVQEFISHEEAVNLPHSP